MLLVLDIGNTNIVLGLFEGRKLRQSWRLTTKRNQTADEYGVLIRELVRLAGVKPSQVKDVLICSVVPPLDSAVESMVETYLGRKATFLDPTQQTLVPILYNPPQDVGADRIVNALAAFKLYGGPVIVVDFGTATTFDIIAADGAYHGGIIAPGVGISAEALFLRAAKLPKIQIARPNQLIGQSTVSSMQSGIYYGYVSLVDGVLARIASEIKPRKVVATGGVASLIGPETEHIDTVEESLTLMGLQLFHELGGV